MKSKSNSKKTRSTLAKTIRGLARSDDEFAEHKALELATYGRILSPVEAICHQFYRSRMRLKKRPVKNVYLADDASRAAKQHYEKWEKQLFEIFLLALIAHDRPTIIELADAAQFFDGMEGFKAADPERLKLLRLKTSSAFNRSRPIREIAEYLNGGKKVITPLDGFSALRRKCKELGIPVKRSRK